jgi:choline dehydrogenase-like flavoprotein
MNSLADNGLAIADYVVVGTGSAGSVLAERLSADLRNQVVVVEAGGRDTDRRIHMPVTWTQLFRSPIDWDYLTEPQAELNGREIYWPRGKTLGGSSSMNAMMWVRGFAADYDEWAEHAGVEWSFNRIVKYFKQIENVAGAREPDCLNSQPPVLLDRAAEGLVMGGQRRPHPLRVGLPQTGRTLHIGEQQRHHPRRSSRRRSGHPRRISHQTRSYRTHRRNPAQQRRPDARRSATRWPDRAAVWHMLAGQQ